MQIGQIIKALGAYDLDMPVLVTTDQYEVSSTIDGALPPGGAIAIVTDKRIIIVYAMGD